MVHFGEQGISRKAAGNSRKKADSVSGKQTVADQPEQNELPKRMRLQRQIQESNSINSSESTVTACSIRQSNKRNSVRNNRYKNVTVPGKQTIEKN
jgi:hypothetical protein